VKDDKQWTWKGQATDMEWKLASVKGANVEVHCLDACEPGFSPGLGGHGRCKHKKKMQLTADKKR